MTNFECCKSKSFPSGYFICIKCLKIYHRCCVLKDKSKYDFIEGFKIRCCDNDSSMKQSDDEKTFLEETISELTENSQFREKHIIQLQKDHEKFIEEATQREEELDTIIKKQQIFIEKANKEILSLKQEIQYFSGKPTSTKSSQTEQIPVVDKLTQTTDKIFTRTAIEKSTTTDSTNISEDKSRKIILVAGGHGKDLVHVLKKRLQSWTVNSVLKLNAGNKELVKTAIDASKHFTPQDIVLLWPNENFTPLFRHFLSSLRHTNFLILSCPYHPTNKYFNDRIYNSNLSLYKEVHHSTGGLKNLIEVNLVLKVTNYNRFGYHINKTGKKFIGYEVLRRILGVSTQNFVTNSISMEKTVNNGNTNLIQNTRTVANDEIVQKTFLYPRLSQEIFPQI